MRILWNFLKQLWLTVRWKTPETCDMCATPGFRGEHLGPISGDWWVCAACWDKVHTPDVPTIKAQLEIEKTRCRRVLSEVLSKDSITHLRWSGNERSAT